MDLFDQVMHALEGDDPPLTADAGRRGKILVTRAAFVEWAYRIERTDTPTALECIALIKFKISGFEQHAERRVVDGWSAALREAADARRVTPRDPITLLPLAGVPEGWSDWGITLTDADAFVASLGMSWTVSAIAEHMLEEAEAAMLLEHQRLAGGNDTPSQPQVPPIASTRLNWKEIARAYSDEEWNRRPTGVAWSKRQVAEKVSRRFADEGIETKRGRITADNILREALNTWSKPPTLRKAVGSP